MTSIKRSEEYTENTKVRYRFPNTSTEEKLEMMVSAGYGAVLVYEDRVLVTDICWKGFTAAIYEFIETPEETGLGECECRLNLIEVSEEIFRDGGHAIAWALAQC